MNKSNSMANYHEQATSSHPGAFNELLDAYESIGESLPLLTQYQTLFQAKPHAVRNLWLIYEDLLKFHHIILRYFQQPRRSLSPTYISMHVSF